MEEDGDLFFNFPDFVKIRVDTTEKSELFGYFDSKNDESEKLNSINHFITCLQKEGFSFRIRNSRVREESKFYGNDGILNSPYFRRKIINFVCAFGAKYYQTNKDKGNLEDHLIDKKRRVHAQPTKKMNCEAQMRIEEIIYYPQYRIWREHWRAKKEAIDRLKRDLAGRNNYSVPFKRRFYVWISLPCVHNHSKITSFSNQPLDVKLKNQINFLVSKGITDVKIIKENLDRLSAVEFPDAPTTSRAFYPDRRTIYNYMLKYKKLMENGTNQPVVGYVIDEIDCTQDTEASIVSNEEDLNKNVVEVEIPYKEISDIKDKEQSPQNQKELIAKIRVNLTRLLNLSLMIPEKSSSDSLVSALRMIQEAHTLLEQNISKENCFDSSPPQEEEKIIYGEQDISTENCLYVLPSHKEQNTLKEHRYYAVPLEEKQSQVVHKKTTALSTLSKKR